MPTIQEVAREAITRAIRAGHRTVWVESNDNEGYLIFATWVPEVADKAKKALGDVGVLCSTPLGVIGDQENHDTETLHRDT